MNESDEEYYDSENSDGDDKSMLDGTQDVDDESGPSDEDDMDMYASGEDFKILQKPPKKSYEIECDSLSQGQVEKMMSVDVEHISGIFGVDASTAALLLRHFEWNKERLIEKYMDNASAVATAAGVTQPEFRSPPASTSNSRSNTTASRSSSSGLRRMTRRTTAETTPVAKPVSKSTTKRTASPQPITKFTCPICCDDDESLTTLSLSCEHLFCGGCWGAYVTSKVREEGECNIRCMAEGCALVAPDTFIKRVCESDAVDDGPALVARYKELVLRSFVAAMSSLKYCPFPSCTQTVSCPGASSRNSLLTIVPTVTCGAQHRFCFGCNIDADHRPVICSVARLWVKKCADDSETANWIKTNTKECSKCQSTIEKNGGCNHMTCKKCKYEFCWVCMGPWSEHGTTWYSCNRYDDKAGIEARDAQSRSRASLERYLHYYNRWANHEQSAKLSVELYAKTEKKMEEMQITSSLTWIEVQFMKKAVDEVEKCRTTLKWTYAMAYYLEKCNEKELFEDNQRDLEKAVEDLSELLESPIDPETIPSLRQKVTDKTVYVQKRNAIMLEDTANGFQEDRWKWSITTD